MYLVHIENVLTVKAGDRRAHGNGAGADKDPVGSLEDGVVGLDLGVQVDLDAELIHLYCIVLEQGADVVFKRRCRNDTGGAAKVAVLFVYGDLVTLECGNTGSFKAGGACTDDNDVLGVVGLFDLERSLLAYLGVDRAGDLGTAVPDTADAVLVAAQAGTYILAVACKQLVGDIGVGDERTAEKSALPEVIRSSAVSGS